uniref:Uncharacterized protein n=1 Tax=Oryza barthii TaxID=65489 RepID=A0A0D3HLI4_9ORYZ
MRRQTTAAGEEAVDGSEKAAAPAAQEDGEDVVDSSEKAAARTARRRWTAWKKRRRCRRSRELRRARERVPSLGRGLHSTEGRVWGLFHIETQTAK